jgi:hypothetical protein
MSIIERLEDDYRALFETLQRFDGLVNTGQVRRKEARLAWLNDLKIGLRIYHYARSSIFASVFDTTHIKECFNSQIQSNYRLIEAVSDDLTKNDLESAEWIKKAFIIKKLTAETLKNEKTVIDTLIQKQCDEETKKSIGFHYAQMKMDLYSNWLCA